MENGRDPWVPHFQSSFTPRNHKSQVLDRRLPSVKNIQNVMQFLCPSKLRERDVLGNGGRTQHLLVDKSSGLVPPWHHENVVSVQLTLCVFKMVGGKALPPSHRISEQVPPEHRPRKRTEASGRACAQSSAVLVRWCFVTSSFLTTPASYTNHHIHT